MSFGSKTVYTKVQLSLHWTKKGAEMAMEFHKEEVRIEFEELYRTEINPPFKFDTMSAWGIGERIIEE